MDDKRPDTTRLSRVLRIDSVPQHVVVGGAQGLNRFVTRVVIGTTVRRLADLEPGTLVVFDRESMRVEDPETEVALRLARSQELAGIVVEASPGPLPRSTTLLAEKFGVPLVMAEGLDAASLVAAIDPVVRAPELAGARSVREFVRRLRSANLDPEALVAMVEQVAGAPTALVDSEAHVLTGDSNFMDGLPEEVHSVLARQHPTPTDVPSGDEIVILQPAVTPTTGTADLWLAARSPAESAVARETVAQILTIASLAFSAHFARQALAMERKNRERALLLAEIYDEASSPSRETVERAAAFGWRLSGWHMGVHLVIGDTARQVPLGRLVPAIEMALAQRDVPASLVQKPDGWVFWITHEVEPRPGDLLALTQTVRRALLQVARGLQGTNLSAGIGRPHPGALGIASSLAEARQACLLAQTSEYAVSVEHIDALNVRSLMTRWYTSTAVRETAGHLLAPLFEADPSGDLVRTLRCYLDNESSTTSTAAILGIHRNTVIQRLAKIRSVLPLDLSRADDRLVAHLATRGTDVQWEEAPTSPG